MYNKYQRLRLEGSQDGINWEVVEPREYKRGELIEEDAAECGGSGEGIKYRWVTIAGEYMCINNDKYTVIKKQVWNKDHWEDVTPLETTYGEVVEKDSGYCGYGEYWQDTERWECASVEGAYTTQIDVYGDGYCMYSYGGQTGGVNGTFWLDTTGGNIRLEAIASDSIRKPFNKYIVNGISFSSSIISVKGSQDNIVSLYFSNYMYRVMYGENSVLVSYPKQPLWVENGSTVTISAKPVAPGYGVDFPFSYWRLGYSLVDGVPKQYKIIEQNPLNLTVTSDCILDLYYANEGLKIGYTLKYNSYYGEDTIVNVSDMQYLRQSHWFFDEAWFAAHAMQTLETVTSDHNDLLYIDSSCFAGTASAFAKQLEQVNFPTVETVFGSAFKSLYNLWSVSLPNCAAINDNAFEGCTALTAISLPKLTYMGAKAFASCSNLQTIYLLGSQVCSLNGRSQFVGCTALTDIIVPASLYIQYRNTWGTYSGLIRSY